MMYIGNKIGIGLSAGIGAERPDGVPSALTSTVISATDIYLAVTRNDTNGEGLKIYSSTDGVTFALLDTVA